MSNLYNQNIGINYKGILNLDTTINTPLDTTLRAVTDGMGTSSPLQLSTDQVGLSRTVALSAGATNPRLFNEVYTINNSGAQTGTLTGLFLNATETALNGITHNLMDLQRAGASNFKVGTFHNAGFRFNTSTGNNYRPMFILSRIGDPTGTALLIGVGSGGTGSSAFIASNNDDMYLGTDVSSTFTSNIILPASGVGKILLGGTTSSFPAIKRNGAGIDFRLADDSAYCNIRAQYGVFDLIYGTTFSIGFAGGTTGIHLSSVGSTIFSATGVTSINASAQLQIDSTTKGFLPPRMTTAQVNAIATPAEGLVVFNTTISHLCVYQAAAWVKLSHSPM